MQIQDEFSCLPSAFVDLSSIEVASHVSILSGGSWRRKNNTPEDVIKQTILQETSSVQKPTYDLSLADIPSLMPYIRYNSNV